jgi:hypothetical protein
MGSYCVLQKKCYKNAENTKCIPAYEGSYYHGRCLKNLTNEREVRELHSNLLIMPHTTVIQFFLHPPTLLPSLFSTAHIASHLPLYTSMMCIYIIQYSHLILTSYLLFSFHFYPPIVSGSRLSSSRTERTDISSVTNFEEGGKLGIMRKAASFTFSADHFRKNDSSPKAVSRRQSYRKEGDGSGEDSERKADLAGLDGRFNSEGEAPPGPPTGFRRAPPNIPHLVGMPFSSPSTPTNTGCASPSEKKMDSPMRKLSIQFGERAKGVFGFLRRGQKGHRASSASLDLREVGFEGNKSQYEMDSTPLDAAPLILHSHSVDSPRNGNGRGRSITADAVSTPRSSLALSEDQDDLGTVIPFDPHSRQSSTHEMLPPRSFHGVPSTYSSIFALEEKDTPESLPPRAPHSANASGSSNGNIGSSNIEHLKTWFPQFDSPETLNHSRDYDRDRQSLDSINKRTPQLSGRHSFTSPSPERRKRPEKMRKGSLTSVISTATVGSPDKYPFDKTRKLLTGSGGREGFEKEKDRTIPVFMRSTFKTRESEYWYLETVELC